LNAFARDDGQFDLEAQLVDVKAYDFQKSDGSTHPAGQPVHDMHLRITINDEFLITDAAAAYAAAPYPGQCSAIAPDYRALIGLNLLHRFRQGVKERFARTAGCTHMTELSYLLPTVALQSMVGRRRQAQAAGEGKRPFHLGGCHALRLDGPIVARLYPEWHEAESGTRRE